MICVPAIFLATEGLLWCLSLSWMIPKLPADLAPWINLATVTAPLMALFYASLGFGSLLTGLAWMAASVAWSLAIPSAGLSLPLVSLGTWITAWGFQFYGHKLEGAKPSFADDLVFLLIGPLFVQQKFGCLLARRSAQETLSR